MSNIYCSPVSTQPSPDSPATPRPRQDCGGFKQLYLLRSASQRERLYILVFSGFRLGRSGDPEPDSSHPAEGSEHGGHLELWQISPGRGRALGRTLRLGQGVLSPELSLLSPTRNTVWCPESFSNKMNIFRHFETTAGRNRKYNTTNTTTSAFEIDPVYPADKWR